MLALGNIDVAVHLSRAVPEAAASSTTALAFLERGVKTLNLSRSVFSARLDVDLVRQLVGTAHNRAIVMYRAQAYKEAIPLGQMAYDIARTTLENLEVTSSAQQDEATAGKQGGLVEEAKQLQATLSRVAELIAVCKYRVEDWRVSL